MQTQFVGGEESNTIQTVTSFLVYPSHSERVTELVGPIGHSRSALSGLRIG